MEKKWKVLFVEGIILCLFFCVIYVLYIKPQVVMTDRGVVYNISEDINYLETLENGQMLSQSFQTDQILTGIEFSVRKLGQEEFSLEAEIYDTENNILLAKENLSYKNIDLEHYYRISFEPYNQEVKLHNYCLKIIVNNNSQEGIAVFGSRNNALPGGKLEINGRDASGDIALNLIIRSDDHEILLYSWIIFGITFLILVVSIYIIFVAKWKIQNIFLFMALSMGMLYMIILAPNSAPDSFSHEATAYHYSNILLGIHDKLEENTILMREEDAVMFNLSSRNTGRGDYQKLFYYLKYGEKSDKLAPVVLEHKCTDSFLLYIFTSLGITIARLLGLNTVSLIYMAEFFNLLGYSILVYIGLRLLPFWKELFAVLGLLPMSLHLAASCSYDPPLTGLVFIFIAYCLRLAYDRTIKRVRCRDALILGVLYIIILPQKVVYCLIAILILLVPKEKLPRLSIMSKCLGALVTVAGLVSAVVMKWGTINTILREQEYIIDQNVAYTYTIFDICRSPFKTILLILNTLIRTTVYNIGTALGSKLGWLDIEPTDLLIIVLGIAVILVAIVVSQKHELKRRDRVIMGSIVFSVWFLTSMVMLFATTAMGYTEIVGVQGRYFIPVGLLGLLSMCPVKHIKLALSSDEIFQFSLWIELLIIIDILRVVFTR